MRTSPKPANVFVMMPVAINTLDKQNSTPLIDAICRNDLAYVNDLLHLGAKTDVCTKEGLSPLHFAAGGGNKAIIEALLLAGASIDARDGKGNTPLMIAARSGTLEAAKLLHERGADIHAVNYERQNVINLALPAHDYACIEYFLSQGAKVNRDARIYIYEHNLDPELHIDHPFAADYSIVRKVWNVFGRADSRNIRETILDKNPLQKDTGKHGEIMPFLREQLALFAESHAKHRSLIQHICEIFPADASNAENLKLPDNHKIMPGYAKVIPIGFRNEKTALIIKATDNKYKLILSENGKHQTDELRQRKQSNPLSIIDIPAYKVDAVARELSYRIETGNHTYAAECISLTSENKFRVITDTVKHNPAHKREYIENYYPLILFMMQLSLGVDEGLILFKQFMLSMRQNVLNDYKQYFANRLDEKDKAVIAACERIIARKKESLELLHTHKPPRTKHQSWFLHMLETVYRNTFYNPENTAKSRLFAFLELPHVDKRYDVVKKGIVETNEFLNWPTYVLGGFILLPVKNIVKLFVEFLPGVIEKIAKKAIKQIERAIEYDLVGTIGKGFLRLGEGLSGIGYAIAKTVKVAARIVTSPGVSARVGWEIHPVLGVISGILSVAAIAFLTLLATPVFLGVWELAAYHFGLQSLLPTIYALEQFFCQSKALLWITSIFSFALSPAAIITKSVMQTDVMSEYSTFSHSYEEKQQKQTDLTVVSEELKSFRSRLAADVTLVAASKPIQSTANVLNVMGAQAAASVSASDANTANKRNDSQHAAATKNLSVTKLFDKTGTEPSLPPSGPDKAKSAPALRHRPT